MASIKTTRKKNGNTSYRAQICINGIRDSASFTSKDEAKAWACEREAEILRNEISHPVKLSPSHLTVPPRTLADVFTKYKDEVSRTKAGRHWEEIRLKRFCTYFIADILLTQLGPEHIAQWRDQRLKQVSASSVRREMNLLGNCIEVARREWRWIDSNPSRDVRKPSDAPHRKQRISSSELQKLLSALNYIPGTSPTTMKQETAVALLLALETAMRVGEILSLTNSNIHLDKSYCHLPITKNGSSRDVPLSDPAKALIRLMQNRQSRAGDRLFSVSEGTRQALFQKAKAEAGLKHIRFHDSRREATTRLSEIFNPLELSRITGHKDLKMLLTYYEKPASELALKMAEKTL